MKRILTCIAFVFVIGTAKSQDNPTTLNANATSSSAITLTWAQVIGTPAAEGYVLYAIETGETFPVASPNPTDDTDLSDGHGVVNINGNATLSYNGFSGLSAGTSYTFRIYSYRAAALSANYIEASDFTFSTEPGAHAATFTAVKNVGDGNRIDLAFPAASALADTEGYVIYRKQGSPAVITGLVDGAAPPASLDGGNTILVTTTTDADISYADDALAGGQTFHYVLVPFNWNGTNAATHNFRTGGARVASATTDVVITVAEIEGGGTNIAASPISSGTTNQAILAFSITTDGPLNLQTLNIPLSANPSGKFSSPRLYQSANTSFGGDANIATGTLQSDHFAFTGINYALSAGTTHFFIVVDIAAGLNAATPAIQPSLGNADITFSAGTASAFSFDGIDYSFADTTPPAILSLNPTDNATQVSASLNQVVITFNEPVVVAGTGLDDANNIRIRNRTDNVNHETIDPTVSGRVTLSAGNTVATITLSVPLTPGKEFGVSIGASVFEDASGNDFAGTFSADWSFTIEAAPAITSFVNATGNGSTTQACINDIVTINGSAFGSVVKPTVTINGTFVVAAADVLTFNDTQITFRLQTGAPNGAITVRNNSNNLTSFPSGFGLTVLPAIATGLPLTLNPTAPAQGNTVNITVVGGQSNLTYDLFRDAQPPDTPDGNGVSIDNDTDDGGSVQLSTGTLSLIGSYYYYIQASRAECTTRLIDDFSITITPLEAVIAAAKTTICEGETLTLQGAASGGTGYNSFEWLVGATSLGNTPNINVSPSAMTTYTLKVTNSAGAVATEDIIISVDPKPSAQFRPGIKSKFSDQEAIYRLSDSVEVAPAGGTLNMVGLSVSKHGDGHFYFDPQAAGPQTDLPVYLSYKVGNCFGYDTLLIDVNAANAVNNLEQFYCENVHQSDILSHNPTYLAPYSYQYWDGTGYGTVNYTYTYKSLALYRCDDGMLMPDGPSNPLQEIGNTGTYRLNPNALAAGGYMYNCFYIIVITDMKITQVDSEGTLVYDPPLYSDVWAYSQYFELRALNQVPSIMTFRADQDVCSDGPVVQLTTDIPSYTTINYTEDLLTADPINYNSDENAYLFDPSEVPFPPDSDEPRTVVITYNYNDGGCNNSVTRTINVIPRIEAPVANDQTYCQFYEGRRVLKVETYRTDLGTSLRWYTTGNALVGEGETFDTGISTAIPGSETFRVAQIFRGCESHRDPATVIITPAPNPNVDLPDQCVDREATFVGPSLNVTSWAWDLGDGTTSTEQTVTHTYHAVGTFNVLLVVTSDINGQVCTQTIKESVSVNQNPTPSLAYQFVCEGDATQLNGGSTDISVVEFAWDFGDAATLSRTSGITTVPAGTHSGRTEGTFQMPRHRYENTGTYNVSLTAYTSFGCYNTIVKPVTILHSLGGFTSETPYFMANEDGGRGYWRVEDMNGNSSWDFAPPGKPLINSASPAWVTDPVNVYKTQDVSFVNSPCLDISGIERPVLSLDYFVNTPANVDGAVLEFSTDNGVTWKSVGSPGEGSNWFNSTGFDRGNIGNSPVGWSGEQQTQFLSGKRALDQAIPDLDNPSKRSNVRFRIAFQSGAALRTQDGFAFRNFSITKRNRTLLVENFTNELDEDHSVSEANFKTIPTEEATRIQYHVKYPGDDSYSSVNTTDPSARAAFYGVVLSDAIIPRGFVDGQSQGNFANMAWVNQLRDERSLIASPFLIDIDASSVVNGQLHINAIVHVVENFSGRPVLHIAVVEKNETSPNSYVLRKMLPNAAGTAMSTSYSAGETISFDQYYMAHSADIDVSDLAVAVFIQDEITKEIYQSEILESPATPDVVTGIETPAFAEKIKIYPNPADKEFTIRLSERTRDDLNIRLIDVRGQEVVVPGFKKGEEVNVVTTKELAGGLYILQLESAKGLVRKKIMVIHQ